MADVAKELLHFRSASIQVDGPYSPPANFQGLRRGPPVYDGSQMKEATVRRARLSASIAAQAAAAQPAAGPLSIANCKAYAVREPVSKRQYAILRLETTGGIVGWGETRTIAAAHLAQAVAILRGRQATEYASLHARLAALPDLRAAANMALLDIVGRAAKAPVYQVLGGPTRHQARALAGVAGADDDAVLAACKRVPELPAFAPS